MNELIKKIGRGELAAGQLRQHWDDMERDFASDGIDADERTQLNSIRNKIEKIEAKIQDMRDDLANNLAEWQSYKADYDELCRQISTLSEWGHSDADNLYQETLKVQDLLRDKCWKDATNLYLATASNAAPAYEEYQQKFEVKKLYDKERTVIEQRIKTFWNSGFDTVKLSTMIKQLEITLVGVSTEAASWEFDAARNELAGMKADMQQVEKEIDRLRSARSEYTQAYEVIVEDITEAKKIDNPDLALILDRIADDVILMEKEAYFYEYKAAMKILRVLTIDLQNVNEYAKIYDAHAKKEAFFLESLKPSISDLESWSFDRRPAEVDAFKDKIFEFKDILFVQRKYASLDKVHQELNEAAKSFRIVYSIEYHRDYVLGRAKGTYAWVKSYTNLRLLDISKFQNGLLAAEIVLREQIKAEKWYDAYKQIDLISKMIGDNNNALIDAQNIWGEFGKQDNLLRGEIKEAFDSPRERTTAMALLEKKAGELVTLMEAEVTKTDYASALKYIGPIRDVLKSFYIENGENTKVWEMRLNEKLQKEATISLNAVNIEVGKASSSFKSLALAHLKKHYKMNDRETKGGGQSFIDAVVGSVAGVLEVVDIANPFTRGVGLGYALIKSVMAKEINTDELALAVNHVETLVNNHTAYLNKYTAQYGSGFGERLMKENRKDWDVMAEFLDFEGEKENKTGDAKISKYLISIGLPKPYSGLEKTLLQSTYKSFLKWHPTVVGHRQGEEKLIENAVEDATRDLKDWRDG